MVIATFGNFLIGRGSVIMGFVNNSELDKSQNLDVEDFIKAFDLNQRLARAVKYLVRYAQHTTTKAGINNLVHAIEELQIELRFSKYPS